MIMNVIIVNTSLCLPFLCAHDGISLYMTIHIMLLYMALFFPIQHGIHVEVCQSLKMRHYLRNSPSLKGYLSLMASDDN